MVYGSILYVDFKCVKLPFIECLPCIRDSVRHFTCITLILLVGATHCGHYTSNKCVF